MRDSMIFYRSFYEAICQLTPEIQAEVYNAIFSYSLDFIDPKLSGMSKTIWLLIKPQLDANIRKFHNGKQPKQKQEISKTEAKQKQTISKIEANVNDNVNVNDNKLTKVSKPRKISFEDSELFDKNNFAKIFEGWSKEKMAHYYDAALRYSIEGNKYVSWELAIKSWERKDKNNGITIDKPLTLITHDRYK